MTIFKTKIAKKYFILFFGFVIIASIIFLLARNKSETRKQVEIFLNGIKTEKESTTPAEWDVIMRDSFAIDFGEPTTKKVNPERGLLNMPPSKTVPILIEIYKNEIKYQTEIIYILRKINNKESKEFIAWAEKHNEKLMTVIEEEFMACLERVFVPDDSYEEDFKQIKQIKQTLYSLIAEKDAQLVKEFDNVYINMATEKIVYEGDLDNLKKRIVPVLVELFEESRNSIKSKEERNTRKGILYILKYMNNNTVNYFLWSVVDSEPERWDIRFDALRIINRGKVEC